MRQALQASPRGGYIGALRAGWETQLHRKPGAMTNEFIHTFGAEAASKLVLSRGVGSRPEGCFGQPGREILAKLDAL